MKRTIIITIIVVVAAMTGLLILNKVTTKKHDMTNMFTEVLIGNFEISISTTGELIAENSVEIKAPEIMRGRDIRGSNIKITDLISEGTVVKTGDYIATLDRTEFDNSLKDSRERLVTLQSNLEMALLDTAVTMTNIRDQISNQLHTVEEADITLKNSKYEPPTTIRQAEINLEKQKRILEQLQRSKTLTEAQTQQKIRSQKIWVSRIEKRISDYEEVLAGFVITSPSPGMVIYKRDRHGSKRRVGSMINPNDRVIATIPDLTSMISKVYVSEVEVNKVQPGQQVMVSVDAFPDKSYTGNVLIVANIGEKLPNSDTKVFEVQIKLSGNDTQLRPSMTTSNKIIIKTFDNVTYIPNECVHTGIDGIPVVYTKNGVKQIVVLGESNDKETVIEDGLKPGTILYVAMPEETDNFRLSGEEFIDIIRDRQKERQALNIINPRIN
ncbi:MAG: HlyD family efflux transporter periplasmic adaptor subunit [Bacteroidales bacterium]|nr:HlyD family efflux transporter periplasmic adaptor subunit [Bacteroidales bacterium]